MEKLIQQLEREEIPFKENEPLAAHCTFRIGGPARVLAEPKSEAQLCRTIALCKECGVPRFLLGNGSNVLFADEGFHGAVIDLTAVESGITRTGQTLTVGAGTRLSAVCCEALRANLTGLEFAYGIPGTVGGAVYMNAGAYGGEMSCV